MSVAASILEPLRRRVFAVLPSDAELLPQFVATRDPAAFRALVERHGPLVLGVARRIVDEARADDVFQATFWTLARRANRVRHPRALAVWLHRTAYRLALDARRAEQSRRAAESRRPIRAPRNPLDELMARELLAVLDAEIERLPDQDRGPLILCCLDGLSLDEAAARLGVSPGAVKGRLERGRSRLRANLARRGFLLPTVLGASLLLAPSVVARPLVELTVSLGLGVAPASAAVSALLSAASRPRQGIALLIGMMGIGVGLMVLVKSPSPQPPPANAPAPPVPHVDNHGDLLPDGAVARFGTIRYRRAGMFGAAVVLPDGKTFLDVDDSLLVRTCDAATGQVISTKKLPGNIASQLQFSQNARVLIGQISEPFNVYHAWDVETGKEIGRLDTGEPYSAFRTTISRDGMTVALDTLEVGTHKLRVWDLARGTHRRIGDFNFTTHAIRLSPDGKILYVLWGRSIKAHNSATGAEIWTHRFTDDRSQIDCTADGKFLFAWNGGRGDFLRLDATTGKPVAGDVWPPLSSGETATILPDSRVLIWTYPSGKGSRVWDPVTGKETMSLPNAGRHLATFPDGKSYLGAYLGGGVIQRWDLTTGKPFWPDTREPGHSAGLIHLAFDPMGRRLATRADDDSVRVWDVATRKPLHTIRTGWAYHSAMAFTSDGRQLFVGAANDVIHLDLDTGREVRRLKVPVPERWGSSPVYMQSCRLSPNGRDLLGLLWGNDHSGGERTGAVVGWDLETGAARVLRDKAFLSDRVAQSPDGEWYVGPMARVRATRTGRDLPPLQIAEGFHAGQWTRPAFAISRDGRLIASGMTHFVQKPKFLQTVHDGAQVWEAATGRPLARIDAGNIGCLAFSPDGRTLATTDWDGLRGWDTVTGDLLWTRPVGSIPRSVYTFSFACWIEFSPDGRTIATGLQDTTALLWAVPPRLPKPAALETPADRDAAWAALLSPDAAKGVAAAWGLADAGPAAVALLRERLKPIAPTPPEQVQKWISALGDAAFAKREAATKELVALGERAEPALRAALAANPSAEARQRIEKLLAAPLDTPPPETVRFLRAVLALEANGSPAAIDVLAVLAKGDPAAPETKAAAAALGRLVAAR